MAGYMAEKWRIFGRLSADDMGMQMSYTGIVQKWAQGINRF